MERRPVWWPARSSKPVLGGSPVQGGFDSHAAPYGGHGDLAVALPDHRGLDQVGLRASTRMRPWSVHAHAGYGPEWTSDSRPSGMGLGPSRRTRSSDWDG